MVSDGMKPYPRTVSRLARVRSLGPRRRLLAWTALVLLAGYAPIVARLAPGDEWMLSVTVAGLVGHVLIADDVLPGSLGRSAEQATTADAVGAEITTPAEPATPRHMASAEMPPGQMTPGVMTPSGNATTRGRPMDDPGSTA
jgi:hypothetical protein